MNDTTNETVDEYEIEVKRVETREGTKYFAGIVNGPGMLVWAWTEEYAREHGLAYAKRNWHRNAEGKWKATIYHT